MNEPAPLLARTEVKECAFHRKGELNMRGRECIDCRKLKWAFVYCAVCQSAR
jgi:hypothetical protein